MKTQLTFLTIYLAITTASPGAIVLDPEVRLLGNLFFPPRELINGPYVLNFDLNEDGLIDFTLATSANIGHIGVFLKALPETSRFVYSPEFVAALDEGFEIGPILGDPTKEFRFTNQIGSETLGSNAEGLFFGEFLGEKTAYLGFEFQAATGTHYGYARITDQGASGMIIESVAWESTPGKSILTGAVPEPSTSLLLGMAVATGLARRKRNGLLSH